MLSSLSICSKERCRRLFRSILRETGTEGGSVAWTSCEQVKGGSGDESTLCPATLPSSYLQRTALAFFNLIAGARKLLSELAGDYPLVSATKFDETF